MEIYKETKFKETEIGRVPVDWEVKEIWEVCEKISSGGTPSRAKKKYWKNGNILWLKTKELFDTNIFCTEEKINEKGLKNSSAKIFPINAIILAMYGATVGKLGILKKEMTTNQACCCMVLNKNNSYLFLFYFLLSKRKKIINISTGAAQQNLNQDIVKSLKIPLPTTLNEQKNISKVLSDLDEKIENNKKINKNLEEIGKIIFKRWFVDFEFPNEKGKPYKSNGGKMKYSQELEKNVPIEWEVEKIKKFFFKTSIKTNSEKFEPFSVGVKGCVPRNQIYKKTITKSLQKNKLIQEGDLIFGLGTNKVVYGFMENEIGCVSSAYFVFRINNLNNLIYFKNIFKYKKAFFENILKPTSRQGQTIDPEIFFRKMVLIPNEKIILKFNKFYEKNLEIIKNNILENQKLQEIRDYLLPKLMKGEIRIKN